MVVLLYILDLGQYIQYMVLSSGGVNCVMQDPKNTHTGWRGPHADTTMQGYRIQETHTHTHTHLYIYIDVLCGWPRIANTAVQCHDDDDVVVVAIVCQETTSSSNALQKDTRD